jgi:ferredoxin
MSNYLKTIALDLSAETTVGKARRAVLESLDWSPTPTTSVSYVAANRVLLVMDEDSAMRVQERLGERFLCYIAVCSGNPGLTPRGNVWHVDGLVLNGHLGHFVARLKDDHGNPAEEQNLGTMMGIANGLFDHVVDASDPPLIGAAIKPPGYHHVDCDAASLDAAADAVAELVGAFEKPRFFAYDADICAHARSGIDGCSRCIAACPTDAIISIGERIEVNPHLCQGGGSCTASCPSGAITYQYPRVEEQIDFLRRAIRDLRRRLGPAGITLLVYDSEHGAEMVRTAAAGLPEHVFPLLLEEIGSLGPELLASVLAYGVDEIHVLAPLGIAGQVRDSLGENVTMLEAVLRHCADSGWRIRLVESLEPVLASKPATSTRENVAAFAGVGGKRRLLRNALMSLLEQAGRVETVALPAASPLGRVLLDAETCTLCMGCVSVCPGNALEAGGEVPALRFIESNCLQCGICTSACPESALTLEARFNPGEEATRSIPLKEEEPFRCVTCGKPFATRAMIDRMQEKLAGHWMFRTPQQRDRLRMCEDCRVADMFDRGDMIG